MRFQKKKSNDEWLVLGIEFFLLSLHKYKDTENKDWEM